MHLGIYVLHGNSHRNFLAEFDTVGEMDEKKTMKARESSGSRFLTPMGQNNNTRGDASETNWERLNSNGEKKQPAYILYIANSLENDEYKEEDKYLESIKAAKQFGIPVVLIDRQKVIENEHLEIDRLVEEYKTTKSVATMKRIIQRFENNRTTYGYNFEFEEKYNAQFPLKDVDTSKSLNSIIQTLVEYSRDDNGNYITGNLQQMIDELVMQTVRNHGNGEKEFCEMVYGIKDKDSSLTVDADGILKRYLGITQKGELPDKISKGFMRSFYFKRENIPEKEPKKQFSKEAVESGLFEITDNIPTSEFNDSSSAVRRDVQNEFEDRENTTEEGWTQDDWD